MQCYEHTLSLKLNRAETSDGGWMPFWDNLTRGIGNGLLVIEITLIGCSGQTPQLTPKQSRWIRSTTGRREYLQLNFWVSCPFKREQDTMASCWHKQLQPFWHVCLTSGSRWATAAGPHTHVHTHPSHQIWMTVFIYCPSTLHCMQ